MRISRPKQNTLEMRYGKVPHDSPDIIFLWGEGCSKCDSHLLHQVLCGKRFAPFSNGYDDSLVEELEKRGYDIKTLRFSIKKKEIK